MPYTALRELSRSERRRLLRLLVASVSAYGRPDLNHGLERLVADAPTEHLPAAAQLHRLSGSVAEALKSVPNIPPEVLGRLEQRRNAATLRHLRAAKGLRSIAEEFDRAAIQWAVMKGPVLASSLYSGPGDREYGDLDVIVSATDLERAVALLEALGYMHEIRNWPLAQRVMASEFVMASPLVDIDLHWHLIYSEFDRARLHVEPAELLARTTDLIIGGAAVPSFGPTDMLLHLAFHTARSGGHRLIWLKDIERCLTICDPDLEELVERAERFGIAPSVALALDRARLVGADVPESLLQRLAGSSLLAAERAMRKASPPIRLHERETASRFTARSLYGSFPQTLIGMVPRGWRSLKHHVEQPVWHETDDVDEKAEFLRSVARS